VPTSGSVICDNIETFKNLNWWTLAQSNAGGIAR